jgi:hypothetical protein
MANQAVKIDGVWKILRIAGWGFVALLLLLPALAMQFTSEVDWSASDFIIMGALLGTVGLTTEFLVRQSGSTAYRIGAVVAMATAFLTIWVNLAVEMIGDDNPYNLLFGGVLLVALAGAVIADFRPRGMAVTMIATGIAQAMVAAGGIATDLRGAMFSMAFAAPWLLAGALFRRADADA